MCDGGGVRCGCLMHAEACVRVKLAVLGVIGVAVHCCARAGAMRLPAVPPVHSAAPRLYSGVPLSQLGPSSGIPVCHALLQAGQTMVQAA